MLVQKIPEVSTSLCKLGSLNLILGFLPVGSVLAVEVEGPVADPVLLVEGRFPVTSAHVRDPTAVLVAHVEDHAVEFQVRVETQRATRAVKVERHVREVLPTFGLHSSGWNRMKDGRNHADMEFDLTLWRVGRDQTSETADDG